jgi:hypothetical protein
MDGPPKGMKNFETWALYQGTALAVSHTAEQTWGFSPCGCVFSRVRFHKESIASYS